jgi:membrane protein implicated in regulation of membrane protease activity
MRLHTLQIVAALGAAVAFVLAFMAAGALIVSGLFMALGMLALGVLAYSMIRRVMFRGRLHARRQRQVQRTS